MQIAVDADEVDVLAVVAAPITSEAGACFRLDRSHSIAFHRVVRLASPRYGVHPVLESVLLFRIQLISRATEMWVHLHAAAYSAGVR